MTEEEFLALIKSPEGKNLEFKSAQHTFSENTALVDYCAAIANEGGGKLILGVSNTRKVIGSIAFKGTINKVLINLYQKLKIKVTAEELLCSSKRVIIFNIPPRQLGQLVKSTGNYTYPMRVGESLVEMDTATMKGILNENEPDFTNGIVGNLTYEDLNKEAVSKFKSLLSKKSGRREYLSKIDQQLLSDLGLIHNGKLINAAVVLLGKKSNY